MISGEIEQVGWSRGDAREETRSKEWIVTNGLGGYASGTIAGINSRRYHGALIAALASPHGRVIMFNHLEEKLAGVDGGEVRLTGLQSERAGAEWPDDGVLEEFRLEWGFPVWRFSLGKMVLEKRVVMSHGQNTTYLLWRLVSGDRPVELRLRPSLHVRHHEDPVSRPLGRPYSIERVEAGGETRSPAVCWEIATEDDMPPLRVMLYGEGARFVSDPLGRRSFHFRLEHDRGYEYEGNLWSGGFFTLGLNEGDEVALVVSTEAWATVGALAPREAFDAELERRRQLIALADDRATVTGIGKSLVLAADQFLITPHTRRGDEARLLAVGAEPRTVIAGYHWFTDWGRDTMISLEGLTLTTGRYREAGSILRTFSLYVRDGLIPNMFPEGDQEGLYHTADATLWFFHAVARFVAATRESATLRTLLPILRTIIEAHLDGTRFGIRVDAGDGLLRQGAEGYQLTWMDAKVGDWVVTPRRGKAVEINALWYNALRLMETWLREERDEQGAEEMARHAAKARASFNERFWNEEQSCLYDVVDGEQGNDPAIRPNQIFAVSLDHPVLDPDRWGAVVEVVRKELLTPFGLRSLAREHPDYKQRYFGDLRARDAAYHQGTVWGWLIGPFVDAWLRVTPDDRTGARRFLDGFVDEMRRGGIGTISEIFDAEEPYAPRGCIAQAWSVAEVLRCLARTADARITTAEG